MARSSSSAVKKSPAKMQEGSKRKFEAEAGPSMSPSSPAGELITLDHRARS